MERTDRALEMNDREIFTRIWTQPGRVFAFINANHYDKYLYVLLFFAGIARAFSRASMNNLGDKWSIEMIIAIAIVGGGLFGWISFYIYAALLSWTGKWLKGEGNTQSILRILAYAMIPSIVALLFLIPQIGYYGNEIFKSSGDISSAGVLPNILVYGSFFMEIVLGIWTILLSVIGISVVQNLSITKSVLNLLLPVIVIALPIILLVALLT